uniref:Spherical body protein 3 n=1 Tax=Babesia orientalis TaxID=273649 RepID=A0A286K5K8_9APIC|nr:spherical body protein 3 [Babesia orientalis]
MRRFTLVALLAATAAAQMTDENPDVYQTEIEDSYMPLFTESQLHNPVIAPLDISSGAHEKIYNAKTFVSKDGKVMSTIFHAPSDSLFKTITCGCTKIFEPTSFLAYKVVVDYVDKEANYVRIYGIVQRGIYGVRYLINTADGFVKVSRAEYSRHRAQYSTPYTLDLLAHRSELLEKNIIQENVDSPQEFTTYYPRFNHHINEVVAGPVKLCSFDAAKAGSGMKVMTYNYEGKKYCVVNAVNMDGAMEEHLFVEDNGTYTRVSQRPKDSFFNTPSDDKTGHTSTCVASGETGDHNTDPNVVNFTQIAPPSAKLAEKFGSAQFLKVNIRSSPREDGPWARMSWMNGYGSTEVVFTAKDGYVIYRLTDDTALIWERPGLGIINATLVTNIHGNEYLQMHVLGEDGATYEYFFAKLDMTWAPVTDDDVRRLSNPNKIGTIEEKIRLVPRDLSNHALDVLKSTRKLPFNTNAVIHYGWMTDVVREGSLLVRKYCTAMDGLYSFDRFVCDDKVIANLKDQYLSTQALHYKSVGLELLGFNAFDLHTGKCSLHYYMKREERWIRIDDIVFYQRINDMLEFISLKRKAELSGGRLRDDATLNEQFASYILTAMTTYHNRKINKDLPTRHEYDSHYGGYNVGRNLPHDRICSGPTDCYCPCQCKCTCGSKPKESTSDIVYITLELKNHEDSRYNVHAVSGRDGSVRINFKPGVGYRFDKVSEDHQIIFDHPDYNVTDIIVDQSADHQFFLQITAYDKEGEQHVFYYYKSSKKHIFSEVCRRTYVSMRYHCMTKVNINVNSKHRWDKNVIRFDSKHYSGVRSYVPRYNCVVDSVNHDHAKIWSFDELNPEIVLRVVTFTRDNIRGVLLQMIDSDSHEVDRLYLNTNPKTNEYAPFIHKGEMFALFKEYLLNRRGGVPGFRKYRENDIDWTHEIKENTYDYERAHSKVYMAPSAYDIPEGAYEDNEECKCEFEKRQREIPKRETPEEEAQRLAVATKQQHEKFVRDNSYYTDIPITLSNIVHKEGVVWDSNGSGEVCLDLRKFDKGQYRLVECDIMTPDGRVEVRYFMNTHNGRGNYKEVELCRVGMDM